jgi:phospholipase C
MTVIAAVGAGPAAAAGTPGGTRTATPIRHFVVLMQEGHSFDNYFGTYPGADGIPRGTCMPRPKAACVAPFPVGGRALVDAGNSRHLMDAELDKGKLDGFVSAFSARPDVGSQAMGVYDQRDIPFYWNVADNYVLFDQFFSSAAGGSVRNHMYWVTGSPGNTQSDSLRPGGFDSVPTIFDRLQAAGISWKFYVQDYRPEQTFRTLGPGVTSAQVVRVPLLNYNRYLDDPALHSRIVDMSQYYRDLQTGDLPAVSFMVPSGSSEHPPGSVASGQRMVQSLVNALMSSSAWSSSAFLWTYDNWGGWYDHVVPPAVDRYGYGFRVPALLVSPYARKGYVDHTTLDFTSTLKFVETNWHVAPLAARDSAANNLTSAFDFSAAPRPALLLGVSRAPAPPAATPRAGVYGVYGAALLGFLLLISVHALRRRRHRERVLA